MYKEHIFLNWLLFNEKEQLQMKRLFPSEVHQGIEQLENTVDESFKYTKWDRQKDESFKHTKWDRQKDTKELYYCNYKIKTIHQCFPVVIKAA